MQQTASGPSQPADGKRAHSPSPSAQPAAATAHIMHSQGTAATAPSLHGPTVSARAGAARHAPSSLATLSSGSGEKPGGSVGMDLCAATSAPPAPLHNGGGEADEADPAIGGEPAASALHAAGLNGQGAVAAPATSASLSGLGEQAMVSEQAGAVADFAEHNPAVGMMAQSSVALAAHPTASTCEGQNGVLAGPVMGAAVGAPGDVASPKASVLVPGPRGSEGTARGAIVAGAAASILTTAAAGEGEGGEEGVEALSPLQAAKAAALAAAAKAAANTGTVLGTGGAISGNIDLGIASGLAMVRARSRAGGQSQPQHAMGEPPNGYALAPLPSTLAVDVELVGSPLAMASGQPSAVLAFGGASQLAAGDDGVEVQQEVALPAAGGSHVAHAHSMIGNGHAG